MSCPISIIGSGRSSASRSARLIASLMVRVVVVAGSAIVTASSQYRFQEPTTALRGSE